MTEAITKIPKAQRPNMPNYGISKKPKGMMSWEWVDEQMAKSRNYWICTTRADGRPHASPVWGVWVEGVLYFGCDPNSVKARNLSRDPHIVVHLESGDDTVIFEGTAEIEKDKAMLKKMAEAYGVKYPPFKPDPEAANAAPTYKLIPETVFAWLEKDFPNTATRWHFA